MSEADLSWKVEGLDEELKQLTLDLFTEIAILEHLARNREQGHSDLDFTQFGVLTHFYRLRHGELRLSSLAWDFQESEADMREVVGFLASHGWLAMSDDADPCVKLTPSGRTKHDDTVMQLGPVFIPVVVDIPREDLQTTVRTLMDLRRTFDNLPDR